MQRLRYVLWLLPLLGFIACEPSAKDQLKLPEGQYWHLTKGYGRSLNGEMNHVTEYPIQNVLLYPEYEYWFLRFKDDNKLENKLVSNDQGIQQTFEVEWQLEDGGTMVRYGYKTQPFDPNDSTQLWTIESLTPTQLILSNKRSDGAVVREYTARSLTIPGTEQVEEVATAATEGAKAKGLIVEQTTTEVFQQKRQELLALNAESLNVEYNSSEQPVATVVEFTTDGEIVIVLAHGGKSEVYYGNGVVHRGGEHIPMIQAAAQELSGYGGILWQDLSPPPAVMNIPEEGHIRFYHITSNRVYEKSSTLEKAAADQNMGRLYRKVRTIVDKYNVALTTL